MLQVGDPQQPGDAAIVITAPGASGYPGRLASVTGRADYDFLALPGQQNYPVQGGQVTVTVIDPATQAVLGVYTGSHLHWRKRI